MIHPDDVSVFIPSRGRADIVRSFRELPPEWKNRTTIVVHDDEANDYLKHNHGVPVAPTSVKGIGKTRDWILKRCSTPWVIMMDDDLYFYRRARPGGIRLIGAEEQDRREMFRILLQAMNEGYVHGGVTARPTTSFWACRYRVCQRVNNFHFFHTETARKYADFTKLKVMEDFHVSLSLLEYGYPNFVLFDYCWNQPGTNTRGGCSGYRSLGVQRECAHQLHKFHPEVVRVRTKSVVGATSWEGMKERTDVVIQWREAYAGGWHPHWELEKFYNTLKMPKEFWT